MAQFSIGLSPWILADGNYGDFKPGQSRKFALEFYGPNLEFADSSSEPFLAPREPSNYSATGEVVFAEEEVWVCNFGSVMAYTHNPHPGIAVGAKVSGEIYLGVEPFDYFESYYALPGMPALTNRFLIERVLHETYPLIYSPEGKDPYKISEAGHTYEEITTTARQGPALSNEEYLAWASKFGSHFILECAILESGLERANEAERFPDGPSAVA